MSIRRSGRLIRGFYVGWLGYAPTAGPCDVQILLNIARVPSRCLRALPRTQGEGGRPAFDPGPHKLDSVSRHPARACLRAYDEYRLPVQASGGVRGTSGRHSPSDPVSDRAVLVEDVRDRDADRLGCVALPCRGNGGRAAVDRAVGPRRGGRAARDHGRAELRRQDLGPAVARDHVDRSRADPARGQPAGGARCSLALLGAGNDRVRGGAAAGRHAADHGSANRRAGPAPWVHARCGIRDSFRGVRRLDQGDLGHGRLTRARRSGSAHGPRSRSRLQSRPSTAPPRACRMATPSR